MAKKDDKSRGLGFAQQQLLRHGWEQGKGLGRAENGIKEAINVKIKCDKGGMGHRQGDQFTFHWWDHVFNKASASLAVQNDEEGVKLKKVEGKDEGQTLISNKKPRKALQSKAKLYGCFVKSATLVSGLEQPEKVASSSRDSSSSSEDEDLRLDLSTATKLSDEDLVKACGGRTAHKGARHGLMMSAKLARLEQQEQEFLQKYGKKVQPEKCCSNTTVPDSVSSSSKDQGEYREEKKAKKRRNVSKQDQQEAVVEDGESTLTPVPQNKKKKRSKEKYETNLGNSSFKAEDIPQKKQKCSVKGPPLQVNDVESQGFSEDLGDAETADGVTNEDVIPGKGRCSGHKKGILNGVIQHHTDRGMSEADSVSQTKKKKKKDNIVCEVLEENREYEEEEQRQWKKVTNEEVADFQHDTMMVKKSKKKKWKH